MELPAEGAPLLMGIVNATPDSFSDGGHRRRGLDVLLAHAHALRAEGAAIVDVGGESGVTNRPAVGVEEEIDRVVGLVARLAAEGIPVSIDTWKAAVAHAAIEAGAVMVNDVSGLQDPEMAAVCARAGAAVVITHTRAVPKVKAYPRYDDVVADVLAFLGERIALAAKAGVASDRIVVDPGVDLAKTPAQSVEVLRGLGHVRVLGHPILLAASRKDFIGALTHRPPRERLAGTLAAVAAGCDAGCAILRVHDVAPVVDYLKVRAALDGSVAVPAGLRLAHELRREAQDR
jgi:dihydropteroate synthase